MNNEAKRIMLSLSLINFNTMTYGGVEIKLHTLVILRDELSISRHGHFISEEIFSDTLSLGDPHSRSGRCGEKRIEL
jgi:hypothetical protein